MKKNRFKVGIVGPLNSCNRIEKVLCKKYSNLEGKIYPVEKIEEAYKVVERSQEECQGLIFTGIGVYSEIVEKISIKKPNIYIPYLANSIIKAFWELKERFPKIKKISMDIIKKEELVEI